MADSTEAQDRDPTPVLTVRASSPSKSTLVSCRQKGRWLKALVGTVSLVTMTTALSGVATGVTFGLFSAEGPAHSPSTVSAGTVTLTNGTVANCPVSNLLPTGTAATACTFTATYSGVAAYVAVDVLIETQATTGGTNLYNPSDSANDLQVMISSTTPSVAYADPTIATPCPGGAPSGSTCYELDDELVSTSSLTSGSIAFSVSFKLPTSSPSSYQGGAAQVVLTTHAIQADNNALSCTTTPSPGSPCSPISPFKWS